MVELNSIKPAASASVPQQIPIPPAMPQPEALHNQQYTIVANSTIGTLPVAEGKKRKRGERGKDASSVFRRIRHCTTCVANEGPHSSTCPGRTGRGTCKYFFPS